MRSAVGVHDNPEDPEKCCSAIKPNGAGWDGFHLQPISREIIPATGRQRDHRHRGTELAGLEEAPAEGCRALRRDAEGCRFGLLFPFAFSRRREAVAGITAAALPHRDPIERWLDQHGALLLRLAFVAIFIINPHQEPGARNGPVFRSGA